MSKTSQEQVREIALSIFLYGYERAKKGLNARDGYIDDEIAKINKLLIEVRIDELQSLDRSSWDAMDLVRQVSDRLSTLQSNLKGDRDE